jgi:hypothetical protein
MTGVLTLEFYSLIGGKGRDVFELEPGKGRSVVQDFQLQQDRLGLSSGLSFEDLTFEQRGKNTLVSAGGDRLMLLLNVESSQISADVVQPL